MGEDHEHRDDAQQLDAGIPLPPTICDSGMCRCAVFDVYAVVVLRGLVLLAHNSSLVCGLSSLRILHTQTDWDILLKDKIEQMFECVVCCR